MKGTEKQIAWAEDIKKGALAQIKDYYVRNNPGRIAEVEAKIEQLAGILPDNAAWWIENRYNFTNYQITMQTVAAAMRK